MRQLKELHISNVKIIDNFWNPSLKKNREITLFHQLQKLKESGTLGNFYKAAGKAKGPFIGKWFNDSDLYKWLEAASYILAKQQDRDLAHHIDNIISIIENAQDDNGYINTYFSIVEPDKKWTNLGIMHELFCAGHLVQAAVAHYESTSKKPLLHVALKLADHIASTFGPRNMIGYSGHEEIELALVDLYRITNNIRYLKLAKFFVDQRGQRNSRFKWELENLDKIAGGNHEKELYRQFFSDKNGNYDGSYAQDHCPVYVQTEAVGHAVRAVYLYCGMADIALNTGDRELMLVLKSIWKNMTEKRMYITGGIGSSHEYEGFTVDYDLPNDRSYSETCAAVGNIMWNFRMLKLTGEAQYADTMERILYNNLLAGVSLDGKRFFYINPLESDGNHSRQEWFECACCPPNLARLLASLERYIYLIDEDDIFINLYIMSEAEIPLSGGVVKLWQETNYPWESSVSIRFYLDNPMQFTLHLRIPLWSRDAKLFLNGVDIELDPIVENGYARITRVWKSEDQVEIIMGMHIERISAHPKVKNNSGYIALQRGPLVYCFEQIDNPFPLDQLILPKDISFEANFTPNILNGVMTIEGEALIKDFSNWEGFLYKTFEKISFKSVRFKAIPYYAWNNRDAGPMKVWIMSDQI